MANSKSAEKRAKQAIERRARNVTQRSKVRTAVKKATAVIEAGKTDDAKAALSAAVPIIDAAAGKGIIHKNKAARHKSRLAKRLKALAGK